MSAGSVQAPGESGTPLLAVEGLSKQFAARGSFGAARAPVRAVDGVSFTVMAGETLALVGESGSGKSTTARLVLRLIEPSAGRVLFEGKDITAASQRSLRPLRQRMQMVFQDPFASLDPRLTVRQTLEEPLIVHGMGNAAERRVRVDEMLALVGLGAHYAERHTHAFSGGQRQRIGIARALMVHPDLVVCDEPVSALDVSIQAQVINLLKDLQARLRLTYLFIAHDLAVVKHMADRVAVMYLGQLVELAPKNALFANPRHPYTRMLLDAIPRPQPGQPVRHQRLPEGESAGAAGVQAGCRFHPRCPFALERCRVEEPALEAAGPGRVAACHRKDELPDWEPLAGEAQGSLAAMRLALYAARKAESMA
ncbi:ATP-binding cassette domain-containing protein [Variovorax sp. J31P179]|uniref:ABC transporter ATP-binding protein n=1 Tax=Variovorax sp. J31P179 TaxID=3053508 RepID=UPI002574DAB9|nr:oligopeptide/dipeptide ABC transporter ATP-binding protein [Variovorax sp. J31P179]MDM0083593.1 ATP-binding cassette domain-containing protein [Variovorax sp. J31P179]